MSVNYLTLFAVLVSFTRAKVKYALVALTPRSDARGIHIPLMFIRKDHTDLKISRAGVNTGFSFYYDGSIKEWDYRGSKADAIYYFDCKQGLSPNQTNTARTALAELHNRIKAGKVEPQATPSPQTINFEG
jgi:hypothetical protein